MGELGMIGLATDELPWVRALLRLLRHPDPVIAELARQALDYCGLIAIRSSRPDPR